MKCPEEGSPQRQKGDQWLSRAGGEWVNRREYRVTPYGYGVPFWGADTL